MLHYHGKIERSTWSVLFQYASRLLNSVGRSSKGRRLHFVKFTREFACKGVITCAAFAAVISSTGTFLNRDKVHLADVVGFPETTTDGTEQTTPVVLPIGSATKDTSPNRITLSLSDDGTADLTLVEISPGTYFIGSPPFESLREDDEEYVEIKLPKSFYIGIYEITQIQYAAVMGTNPSQIKNDHAPVDSVTWFDAVVFCEKASKITGYTIRLPSEAEWEIACRAGSKTPFHTGKTLDATQANFNAGMPSTYNPLGVNTGRPLPVGTYAPNRFGLHDMHGNVWEWCSDAKGMKAASRYVRGGGWNSLAKDCRSANRGWRGADKAYRNVGFRVVAEIKNEPPRPKSIL